MMAHEYNRVLAGGCMVDFAIYWTRDFTDKVIPRGTNPDLLDTEAPNQPPAGRILVCWLAQPVVIMRTRQARLSSHDGGEPAGRAA